MNRLVTLAAKALEDKSQPPFEPVLRVRAGGVSKDGDRAEVTLEISRRDEGEPNRAVANMRLSNVPNEKIKQLLLKLQVERHLRIAGSEDGTWLVAGDDAFVKHTFELGNFKTEPKLGATVANLHISVFKGSQEVVVGAWTDMISWLSAVGLGTNTGLPVELYVTTPTESWVARQDDALLGGSASRRRKSRSRPRRLARSRSARTRK